MKSPLTLGFVYIVLGGVAVSGFGGHRPLGVVAYVLAGLLVLAGLALLTRKRPAYFFAIAVAALTSVTGVLAYAHHPELALPVHPLASIGFGLYLIFRTAIATPASDVRKKAFIP